MTALLSREIAKKYDFVGPYKKSSRRILYILQTALIINSFLSVSNLAYDCVEFLHLCLDVCNQFELRTAAVEVESDSES